MSKYTKRAETTIDFDGDKVTISVDRVSVEDAMALRCADQAEKLRQTQAQLTKNGLRIDGLKMPDGSDVPVETVFSEFYFNPVIVAATQLLLSTGKVPKAVEDPFANSSPTSSITSERPQASQ